MADQPVTQQLSRPPDAGPVMDPRIRQRRVDVRRREGRKRLWFLVVVAVVLVAAGAAVGATRSPLLDVDGVEVRGATQTPKRALLAAGGLDRQPLMVDVDAQRVSRRVEALPWVLRARTRRAWPGTVVIDVTERAPAAAVRAGAAWATVDATGRVLDVGPLRAPGIPAVVNVAPPGAPGTSLPDAGAGPLRVVGALPPSLHARVREIVTTPGGEVVLQLATPGGEIRLGRPENLESKMTAALTVLDKANVARLAVLDVRVPAAPVLTRR
ncbi:MAG: FtsQ-type POTRA domain-containing protein [Actinomycetota bacterium]|nr:FtsQ-type POTRA domain-containing protein [Actinomycetota bacterium]